tara:strand:- start:1259 stop:1702 length:444 start_codon:yes stop_codon:yes gene_type:complete
LINEKKIKVLIVLADFYKNISNNLLCGAQEVFKKEKINYNIIRVPGALEIAQTIKFYFDSKLENYDGFLALGCVIKGDTYHFEIVSNESARSLSYLSIHFSIPIANGILTTFDKKQALERSDKNKLNKGKESALACLSMIKIRQKLN